MTETWGGDRCQGLRPGPCVCHGPEGGRACGAEGSQAPVDTGRAEGTTAADTPIAPVRRAGCLRPVAPRCAMEGGVDEHVAAAHDTQRSLPSPVPDPLGQKRDGDEAVVTPAPGAEIVEAAHRTACLVSMTGSEFAALIDPDWGRSCLAAILAPRRGPTLSRRLEGKPARHGSRPIARRRAPAMAAPVIGRTGFLSALDGCVGRAPHASVGRDQTFEVSGTVTWLDARAGLGVLVTDCGLGAVRIDVGALVLTGDHTTVPHASSIGASRSRHPRFGRRRPRPVCLSPQPL